MGRAEVESFFSKVGASASALFHETEDNRFKAVGEFGIGVISYFLVADRFFLHTMREGEGPIGLEFSSAMLDARTRATEVASERADLGTTVILELRSRELFGRLLERFGHWVRDVPELEATRLPSGERINQGGLSAKIYPVELETPNWVERAHLGPPQDFDTWTQFDGKGRADILYRGIFVDRVEIDHLWAIEGSIHVDPKHFKPKLNREGFVGDDLKNDLTNFLRTVHPQILAAAIQVFKKVISQHGREWTIYRWATLWLAVPRTPEYLRTVEIWDEEFRTRRLFRLLGKGDSEKEVSIADLQEDISANISRTTKCGAIRRFQSTSCTNITGKRRAGCARSAERK